MGISDQKNLILTVAPQRFVCMSVMNPRISHKLCLECDALVAVSELIKSASCDLAYVDCYSIVYMLLKNNHVLNFYRNE